MYHVLINFYITQSLLHILSQNKDKVKKKPGSDR